MTNNSQQYRRQFLKFLLSSPLIAKADGLSILSSQVLDPDLHYLLSQKHGLVARAGEAINVFDLERVARDKLPPAHYGYIATGVTSEVTQIANRDAFNRIQLRMRRLIDTRKIDMSVDILGRKWPTPIGLAPAGSQKAFHPLGELAVAKAARTRQQLQILSTVSTTSVEDVNAARGEPVWYQLTTMSYWPATLSMLQRAEAAGCPVLVITVDTTPGENRETLQKFIQKDQRNCAACHGANGNSTAYVPSYARRPHVNQLDFDKLKAGKKDALTWDLIDKIRQSTSMKIVLKGIVTGEDARLSLAHGIDGIIVSNHGGRSEPTGRGTIDSLPEVVAAVEGKIPVFIDGGIRRGSDVFKAMALGAQSVFIGRPYLWGLGAFGQEGVEKVLDILRAELSLIMKQAGTPTIGSITKDHVIT